ncbi:hypothetical protein Trydic_g12185 [Trypoxylus dichotomus]
MQLSGSSVRPIAHVLFVNVSTEMGFINGKHNCILGNVFENRSPTRRVHGQLPTCMDDNEGHCVEFASLNDRKVQEPTHVCAQNAVLIPRFKLSLSKRPHVI